MPAGIKPETLKEIAEYLDMGMLCFYNKANGEVEYYPDELEDSGLEDEWAEVTDKIAAFPGNYLQIEKMSSREAFKVMESFIDNISHIPTRNRFEAAISHKKPFAHFNEMLSYYPDIREQWFIYKQNCYIEYVKSQFDLNS